MANAFDKIHNKIEDKSIKTSFVVIIACYQLDLIVCHIKNDHQSIMKVTKRKFLTFFNRSIKRVFTPVTSSALLSSSLFKSTTRKSFILFFSVSAIT